MQPKGQDKGTWQGTTPALSTHFSKLRLRTSTEESERVLYTEEAALGASPAPSLRSEGITAGAPSAMLHSCWLHASRTIAAGAVCKWGGTTQGQTAR